MRPLGRGGNAGRLVGPMLSTASRRTMVTVPEDVADALRSEKRRDTIPTRVELGPGAVPFAGELYEQVSTNGSITIGPGKTIVLCGLRRAWPLVGFAINPGDGAMLTAALRVTLRGVQGAGVAGSAVAIPANTPLASQALFVAARAELILTNAAGVSASGVRGTIYGMTS